MTIRHTMMMLAFALTFGLAANAAEPQKLVKPENTKTLHQLEERAETSDDWARLGELWQQRAEWLEAKAERHDRLEKRYASAPKSLLAKRGHAWNTPGRQAQLAKKARTEAAKAREAVTIFMTRADCQCETQAVD